MKNIYEIILKLMTIAAILLMSVNGYLANKALKKDAMHDLWLGDERYVTEWRIP